ncbi:periplasmic heavy metal sensor [Paucidesulfovibrio longus]|uniref:periplasmic heavy metal sensor n=1 Tax=Paucidesulfovibrio longus TaxID=889 RepID=UPI00138AC562|nr:periplasmic heavy metal sensor [Paucidesulfovibrio longus]
MAEKRRTLTGYLLIGSLAVNLLLGGYFIAGLLRHPFHPPNPFVGLPNPHQISAVLPEDSRPLIRSVLDVHEGEVRTAMTRLFTTQKQVAAAMRAEPFDPDRLRAVLDEYSARQMDLIVAHQHTVADLVGRLDAQGRANVAELLKLPPPPKNFKGKFPPPPPQD